MELNFDEMRQAMVSEQLIPQGISDEKVLDAFRKVERHKFIPKEYWKIAYNDYPLPIGNGQTISQPYMVGLMTESLNLKDDEKVLEIGTGSGYQAAILAELAKEVYTVERVGELSDSAKKVLTELGYKNVYFEVADGTLGWKEKAPFDGIIVTAGAPDVPEVPVAQAFFVPMHFIRGSFLFFAYPSLFWHWPNLHQLT